MMYIFTKTHDKNFTPNMAHIPLNDSLKFQLTKKNLIILTNNLLNLLFLIVSRKENLGKGG